MGQVWPDYCCIKHGLASKNETSTAAARRSRLHITLTQIGQMEKTKKNTDPLLDEITGSEYKYGFTTDIDTELLHRGLDEDVIRLLLFV